MTHPRSILLVFFLSACLLPRLTRAEDGYRLWLRYDRIDDPRLLQEYRSSIRGVLVYDKSPTLHAAANELKNGLDGLLGQQISFMNNVFGWVGRGYVGFQAALLTALTSAFANRTSAIPATSLPR